MFFGLALCAAANATLVRFDLLIVDPTDPATAGSSCTTGTQTPSGTHCYLPAVVTPQESNADLFILGIDSAKTLPGVTLTLEGIDFTLPANGRWHSAMIEGLLDSASLFICTLRTEPAPCDRNINDFFRSANLNT